MSKDFVDRAAMSSSLKVTVLLQLASLVLDTDEYVGLLGKLIGESRHVQNNPRQGLVPNEAKVVQHVLGVLEPLSTKQGGVLEVAGA